MADFKSTVYYWDKPIWKSSYVGFALFFCTSNDFVSMIFKVLIPLSHFLMFQRTKTWQNLCLFMSFANYADFFTLRFVFHVNINVQAMAVQKYPSSRHDNERFLVYI